MKTDYELTGKTYKKLAAYGKFDHEKEFKCFCVSVQFKTCKRFKEFLQDEFKNLSIKVCVDK